jgi:hypothetical protein
MKSSDELYPLGAFPAIGREEYDQREQQEDRQKRETVPPDTAPQNGVPIRPSERPTPRDPSLLFEEQFMPEFLQSRERASRWSTSAPGLEMSR